MPTRSGLAFLFALLVGVPIAAAVYFGATGLGRERGMLIEQERRAMAAIADELRDRFVLSLQALYREAWQQRPTATNNRRDAIHDRFEKRGAEIIAPWSKAGDLPVDIAAYTSGSNARSGSFQGDLLAKPVGDVIRGFRVDPMRLSERYLDPDSPHTVVPGGSRFEYAKLVQEDQRLQTKPDRFGLHHVHYRYVVPGERAADPVLLPDRYVLEIGIHPAAALSRQLGASQETLLWTLGGVAVVVVLGVFFAWRALRAETRLAARKAEFVSAVSHELRTPLTSIRMYADMLKEGWVKDPDTAQDYFGLISAESERLARLVNNVLDFSRIEKGKKAFNMRIGDPAPVVRDVVEVLGPYLREKGFDLEVEVPDSLPECSFDKDALTQILVNLIDNAVKYGKEEVRVEAEAGQESIVLRVLDRGPGIPIEERERIFEAFHRGAAAKTGGGSGLGLALVQHYVEAHRGRIEVRDREGGGAVFAFSLPLPAA